MNNSLDPLLSPREEAEKKLHNMCEQAAKIMSIDNLNFPMQENYDRAVEAGLLDQIERRIIEERKLNI